METHVGMDGNMLIVPQLRLPLSRACESIKDEDLVRRERESELLHRLLVGNRLRGTIPSSIGNIVNLQDMFEWCFIRETVKLKVGDWIDTNSFYRDLHKNYLSGTIPSTIGNFFSLKTLYEGNKKRERRGKDFDFVWTFIFQEIWTETLSVEPFLQHLAIWSAWHLCMHELSMRIWNNNWEECFILSECFIGKCKKTLSVIQFP